MILALVLVLVSAPTAAAAEGKPFGIASFSLNTTQPKAVSYESGFINEPYSYTQAGGHPAQLTSKLEFVSEEIGSNGAVVPTRDPKDVITDMPMGLIANPLAVPRCERSRVASNQLCPDDSQIGVFVVHFFGNKAGLGPIVDLTPEARHSAEFGMEAGIGSLLMQARLVRTPQGYGLRVVNRGLPSLSVVSIEITLWGVPAAAEHDPERGLFCGAVEVKSQWSCEGGSVASGVSPAPFLTMPADCSAGPPAETVWADSWEEPGRYEKAQASLPAMTNCERIQFNPEIEVQPQTSLADEPLGMGITIENRQEDFALSVPTTSMRDATITLPPGVSIGAAMADGIEACNPTGPQGIDMPTGLNSNGERLSPEEIGEGEERDASGEGRLVPGHCPEASTVGTVEAFTPLLPLPVKGRVYLAMPGCGEVGERPCTEADAVDGNIYRMYIELDGETGRHSQGVDIKMEGRVEANTATGQLTVVLENNPQLPLTQLTINLTGGPRALLDNPATCGPARTTSDLVPWSAPGIMPEPESRLVPGTPEATPTSFYAVTGCTSPSPFHPQLIAGTLTPEAGAFSDFIATIIRGDREQFLSGLQLKTPPGLAGLLSSVPLCSTGQAGAGSCPSASQIGKSIVALGAGSHPFEMRGNIYLTTGYEGAPFGISIVINAVAGPINLGTVVIRARVDIDSQNSALTITSSSLPQIVFGVPLRIQRITIDIDRANFIFNPTNCDEQQITAQVAGNEGAIANLSNRFDVGGCTNLLFKPMLRATATAGVGGRQGASLDIKLKEPRVAMGAQANISSMRVSLPKQLPVRLTALRGSCSEEVFVDNPAKCPQTSVIGIARALTPVLSDDLVGPVYFVAHGRARFPSPIVILQGAGVRLDLNGTTKIARNGTVSVAFTSIPDVSISTFELYLPQGVHSLLNAGPDLCASMPNQGLRTKGSHTAHSNKRVTRNHREARSLAMPTELVAQNGALMRTNTKVSVAGCSIGHAAQRSA